MIPPRVAAERAEEGLTCSYIVRLVSQDDNVLHLVRVGDFLAYLVGEGESLPLAVFCD